MNLDEIRKRIDAIDEKLIELLNERTRLASKIGEIKRKQGIDVYSPDRESEIYKKIDSLTKDGLSSEALKTIYREIMSASLAMERPLVIAYLGPEATFTHLASLSKFGSSVKYLACGGISDVFREVDRENADYGVIPIENTIEGAVSHSLDMFIDSDLTICSEIIFEISHYLMSNSDLSSIKRVYSKDQVFGQCRIWLETNLPKAELIETSSTSEAARRAAKEDGAAAIASKLAATIYNLKVLAESIEDSPHNRTRFLVIGRQILKPTGEDKTSIVVSIKDKVGALYEMLEPIKRNRINMTKIESRPSKKKAWDYYFFIDLEGHIEEASLKKTLDTMEKKVRFLKVLGSYPKARER